MFEDTIKSVEALLIEHADTLRAGFHDRDEAGRSNPSGDEVKQGDVRADALLERVLLEIESIGEYASEERSEPIQGDGHLAVAVDPLDGSSNLQANNTVGTIVSLYDKPLPAGGDALIGAWYLVFGPLTTLIATDCNTVREIIIEDHEASKQREISIPPDPTVYGVGGQPAQWSPTFRAFIAEMKGQLKVRYSGAMVADINQVLFNGGIFSYPALESSPQGKLRVQFEAIPMAAIITAAGGASTNGTESLLEISPSTLHQRTPVHIGNETLIRQLEATKKHEVL